MRGYDLPTVGELLQVHGGIAHHLLFGAGERNCPPGQGKSQVRSEKFDLDTGRIDEPHRVAVRVTIDVGIVKLLPAGELLGVNNHQQLRRFPVDVQVSLEVMGIPSVEHFEQDLVDLLGVGLGNG